MIEKIISGGQTGADQAGLSAARQVGLQTGGYAPKGWLTEDGPKQELLEGYGLKETIESGYRTRTVRNVAFSDATLIFGNERSPGSILTIAACERSKRPYLVVPYPTSFDVSTTAKIVAAWLTGFQPKVLNVAGNRESRNPGIFAFTKAVLLEVLPPEPHCKDPNCKERLAF